jgi:hypothetical protein
VIVLKDGEIGSLGNLSCLGNNKFNLSDLHTTYKPVFVKTTTGKGAIVDFPSRKQARFRDGIFSGKRIVIVLKIGFLYNPTHVA